ncbi:MAG: hypothetical protein E7056_06840 [Lentisphaerae bacterium]|nr:hypothetical protein [Lentisphaerota bacterium]
MKNLFFGCAAAVILSGCCGICDKPSDIADGNYNDPITVCKTDKAVKIDGKLDDAIWQTAPKHEMVYLDNSSLSPEKEAKRMRESIHNEGYVQMAYDDKYVYIAASLEDQDVLSYVEQDQEYHFRNADTLEMFFWPTEGLQYWEFYATPNNYKTSYWYLSGGLLSLNKTFEYPLNKEMKVASTVQGTLNKQDDSDTGWITEVAIPLTEFTKHGVKFEPGQSWKVQIARYNHSANIYKMQLSSYPKLPIQGGFHNREYYAPVIFK